MNYEYRLEAYPAIAGLNELVNEGWRVISVQWDVAQDCRIIAVLLERQRRGT